MGPVKERRQCRGDDGKGARGKRLGGGKRISSLHFVQWPQCVLSDTRSLQALEENVMDYWYLHALHTRPRRPTRLQIVNSAC